LVIEKERVTAPKHFEIHPWYHGLETDYFMYSIHNMVQDEAPPQLVEEKSTDMMCMLDEIYFMADLPKYDQYDENYLKMNSSKQSTTYFLDTEGQLQLKYDHHPMHRNYDSNGKNAENLRVSGKDLPLCFSSFQFLRENYKHVLNSKNG
jgi:hypothetical protein